MSFKRVFSVLVISILFMLLLTSCQSPELTSAKVYFQQENIEKAKEQLLIAKSNEPSNPEVPWLLATKIYMPEKEWDKAREELDLCVKIDPTYKDKADNELRRVWAQFHTKAANIFNEGIQSIFPEDKDSLLTVAAAEFEKALEIKKDKATYNGIIKCYFITNDSSMVIKHTEDAMENGIFDKDIIYYYTQVLWRPGNKENALTIIEDILAEHSDFLDLNLLYIQYLTELDRNDIAIKSCEELSNKYPSNLDIKFILAQIYVKNDRLDEATREFEKVLAENPDDNDVIIRIAEAYFKVKDYEMSEKYSRKFVEVAPEEQLNIGYDILWKSLYNQGKQEEAEKYRAIQKQYR